MDSARYARTPSDPKLPIQWSSHYEDAQELAQGKGTPGPPSVALRRVLNRRYPPEIRRSGLTTCLAIDRDSPRHHPTYFVTFSSVLLIFHSKVKF